MVKAATLQKVLDYLHYHVDKPAEEIEKPLKSSNMADVVAQWDADYIDVEQEMLFDLILVRTHARVLADTWPDALPCLSLCAGGELHGHQAAAGPVVRQGGVHAQGQDARTDP